MHESSKKNMDTDVFTAFNGQQKEGMVTNEHTRTSPVQRA